MQPSVSLIRVVNDGALPALDPRLDRTWNMHSARQYEQQFIATLLTKYWRTMAALLPLSNQVSRSGEVGHGPPTWNDASLLRRSRRWLYPVIKFSHPFGREVPPSL